jgi:hypothetical protein
MNLMNPNIVIEQKSVEKIKIQIMIILQLNWALFMLWLRLVQLI